MHSSQRSPLNGRGPESFSEDPLLSGKVAAAMIRGAQNNGVMATAKHLVCYEQCTDMFSHSSEVSERVMREIYLRPFQTAIKDADVKCMMTSLGSPSLPRSAPANESDRYQKLNGLHASEDPIFCLV